MNANENEKKQAEINRLYRRLYELEKAFEKAQRKRMIITVMGFAILYYIVLITIDAPKGLEYLYAVILALVIGGVHVIANAAVFGWLYREKQTEESVIESVKKEIAVLKEM